MLIWILAAAIVVIALLALFLAANAGNMRPPHGQSATRDAHYKALLSEIEADLHAGRISENESKAAKVEIARELVHQKDALEEEKTGGSVPTKVIPLVLLLIGFASFGVYSQLGNPALPAQPLALRTQIPAENITVDEAIARVEAQLRENPDDARGWSVIGPVYMRANRFDEAVVAFRRVLELIPVSADAETDLAEAIMMANGGSAEGEPIKLLQSAAARDPQHIRSRFYLAGEATRTEDFEQAMQQWQALIALAAGDEPWLETARSGLAVAEAGISGAPLPTMNTPSTDPGQEEMIRGMVEGLSERLFDDGGDLEEWTRLVRSRLVLGEVEAAQSAYDAAKQAFPNADQRVELDIMARQAGLE